MSTEVHGRRVARSGTHWGYVFAGGATGAAIRAGFEKAVPTGTGEFPWPTLLINAVGAFVLAWTVTRLARHPDPLEKAFLVAGFCGDLTTFATMQLELVKMLDEGYDWLAFGYAGASVAVGLLAAWIAVAAEQRREVPR